MKGEDGREYRLKTKENQMIWVSVKQALIRHGEGMSLYVLLMLENVTEQKAMMGQLSRYRLCLGR